jgi:predicted dehydrogenase
MVKRILCSVAMFAGVAAGQAARFVIVEPGHFHAAMVLKDMYPQVSPRVSVYTSLTPDLQEFLNRVTLFNTLPENPTGWQLDIHTGPAFFDRMLAERPGDAVVFAGRNRDKIGRIARSIDAGLHVLADKPWVIASEDLPKLAAALDTAERKRLVAYDIMTERYEVTSILAKELVNTLEVFGELERGSAAEPAIRARSIHYLMKSVAGVPLRRPAWFLNIEETGEGLADVGTHVVDLVQWTAFPGQAIDYRSDIEMLEARRWPTVLTQAQFTQVTGEPEFPAHLARWVKDRRLQYFANHSAAYRVRGAHVALDIEWGWEAPPGAGDLYEATFRGSRSRVEIRQGREQNFLPEIYIVPAEGTRGAVSAAIRKKIGEFEKAWPGLAVEEREHETHIVIPAKHRVGHEAHFAQVTRAFLGYLADPRSLPAWEKRNMLVKYWITTKAVELSRTRP